MSFAFRRGHEASDAAEGELAVSAPPCPPAAGSPWTASDDCSESEAA